MKMHKLSNMNKFLGIFEYISIIAYMVTIVLVLLIQYNDIKSVLFWIFVISAFIWFLVQRIKTDTLCSILAPNLYGDIIIITFLVDVFSNESYLMGIEVCGIFVCIIDAVRWVIEKYE